MTERMKLTEEFILENSHWSPETTNQILENQKIVNKIQKRFEINLAVLMGTCPLDENLEEYQLRYQQVEKEQKLIKNILQDDGKDAQEADE